MYLTQAEYTAYGGAELTAVAYSRYEYNARRIIDNCTFNRITEETPVRECVKRLMFELIQLQQRKDDSDAKYGFGVKSMSNDGVSVTLASEPANTSTAQYHRESVQLVNTYLNGETTDDGTFLLSRWVGRC